MRRYDPVTLKDARADGHSVVLLPIQPLELVLTDPFHLKGGYTAEDRWSVKAYSDFFTLRETISFDNKKKFIFDQYYDLTEWVGHGAIFLGDIEYQIEGRNISECRSLCVYARAKSWLPTPNRVVTAINPKGNRIKIDPDEILEVVCYESSHRASDPDYWCSMYEYKQCKESRFEWFEKLREEVVVKPGGAPVRTDMDTPFRLIPRDVANLKRNPALAADVELPLVPEHDVARQWHFWFRVKPDNYDDVLKHGWEQAFLGNLVFGNNSGECNSLEVALSCRAARKRNLAQQESDSVKYVSQYRGLVDRFYSAKNCILVNPAKQEGVEMLQDQAGIMVEMAPPKLTWPDVAEDARWSFRVEAVVDKEGLRDEAAKRLLAQELPSRWINDCEIQRFFIHTTAVIPEINAMLYLGHVSFFCPGAELESRKVDVWLTRKRNDKDERSIIPARTAVTPPPRRKKHQRGYDHTDYDHHGRFKRYTPTVTPPPQPHYMKVAIKEEIGALDFKGLKFDFLPWFAQEAKKKGNTTVDTSVMTPLLTHRSNGSSQSSERKNMEKSQTSSNNGAGVEPPIFLTDPSDNDSLILKPNQYGLIELPAKANNFGGLQIDHFWCVNPIQAIEQRFFIHDIRTALKNGRLWQQVKLGLVPSSTPRDVGQHFLGGIYCSNNYSSITIAVFVQIDDPAVQPANMEYSRQLRSLLPLSRAAKEKMKQSGSVCFLKVEPRDTDDPISLQTGDSLLLKFFKVAKTDPVSNKITMMSHFANSIPTWLNLKEATPFDDRNEFLFVVNECGKTLHSAEAVIGFRLADGDKRSVKVQLTKEAKMSTA